MRREVVERAIEDEEQTLSRTADLLRSHVPWEQWPPEIGRALGLALHEPAVPETSAWQARVLRRHLFGPRTWRTPLPVPTRPTPIEIRRAERLRADLPRLVTLRAGAYLIGALRPAGRTWSRDDLHDRPAYLRQK